MSIQTLAELFLAVSQRSKDDLLMHKVGGEFRPVSTAQLVENVQRLAKSLAAAGVEPGDRVALMAENGPHWPTVDFATLCLGAVLVPVYPTLTPEQAAYILRDSGAKVVFAHGLERLAGIEGQRESLPRMEHLVLIRESEDEAPGENPTLESWLEKGEGADAAAFEERARQVGPEDLATFIYTSGTTGEPKGVMLTHRNIASNVDAASKVLDIDGYEVALSFLPLSHSFERTVDYVYFNCGVTIAYAESVAAVAQNFQEVRPHCFVSVPRVYEKVLGRVHESIAAAPALRQKIFHWAVEVGREALEDRLADRVPAGLLGIKLAIADKLVFAKIRARLGGRFKFAVSGGAPLSREVAEFFWGAGIPIYEGYGLSETSPVLSVNRPGRTRLGTVGPPLDGVELHIAEDGEILARGPNIMKGYHNLPEATAEAIDADGWFHTGDIGEIDEEGFLSITDRKKEIIVNAYGKNVAPAPIENLLKSSRFIGQVMIIGDRQKFLTALVVPDFENLEPWAKEQGIDAADHTALVENPKVRELFEGEVEAVNRKVAKYEKIVRFDLVPQEWTVESGELTPTMKIKRRVIVKTYADQIAEMAAE